MASNEITGWQKLGYGMTAAGLLLSAYAIFRPSPPVVAALPPEKKRLLDPGDHWLLVGDSIGQGVQASLAKLSANYGSMLTSEVEKSTFIDTWSKRADDTWGAYKVVVISLGSNDATRSDPMAQMPDLRKLVQHLRSHGADVFWLVPPMFTPGALKPKQKIVTDMFAEVDVPPLDLRGPRVSVEQDPQRVHPSPAGYQILAGQIFDALTRGALAREQILVARLELARARVVGPHHESHRMPRRQAVVGVEELPALEAFDLRQMPGDEVLALAAPLLRQIGSAPARLAVLREKPSGPARYVGYVPGGGDGFPLHHGGERKKTVGHSSPGRGACSGQRARGREIVVFLAVARRGQRAEPLKERAKPLVVVGESAIGRSQALLKLILAGA